MSVGTDLLIKMVTDFYNHSIQNAVMLITTALTFVSESTVL